MNEREKIARRIRALLAKTVENGCTEDEAIAAAELAARLLAAHNMTVDEAQMRETPFTRHQQQYEDAVGQRLWKPADSIAFLTGCRYWTSGAGVYPKEISFFGFDHEVEIARYLLDICARAMRDGEQRMVRANALLVPLRRRRKVLAYLDGMADTLRRRIRELRPPDPTGTGLIVLRNALIDTALDDAGIKLGKSRGRSSWSTEAAYAIGAAAGERVGLNPAIGAQKAAERYLS